MKTNKNSIIKIFRYGTLFIAISLLSPGTFAQSRMEKSKPNVIMIIFDDLRDHESFTPFEVQTPNFDRLAKRKAKNLTKRSGRYNPINMRICDSTHLARLCSS